MKALQIICILFLIWMAYQGCKQKPVHLPTVSGYADTISILRDSVRNTVIRMGNRILALNTEEQKLKRYNDSLQKKVDESRRTVLRSGGALDRLLGRDWGKMDTAQKNTSCDTLRLMAESYRQQQIAYDTLLEEKNIALCLELKLKESMYVASDSANVTLKDLSMISLAHAEEAQRAANDLKIRLFREQRRVKRMKAVAITFAVATSLVAIFH